MEHLSTEELVERLNAVMRPGNVTLAKATRQMGLSYHAFYHVMRKAGYVLQWQIVRREREQA